MTARSDERLATSTATDPPEPAADPLFDRSVTVVSVVGLVALVARVAWFAVQPLANPDTWFHLAVGHRLWGPWSIARPGELSRYATERWVPTQWATEMLAAKVEDWFGLPGVAWLWGAFYVAFVLGVYVVCRRRAATLTAALVTGAVVVAASGALSARPQVLSLLLFLLAVACWQGVGLGGPDARTPWALVPLTWAWACLHGLWSAGVVLGFAVAVGCLLDAPRGRRPWWLLAVPTLSLIVAAVTPVGPRLLTSQLVVSARAGLVSEWMPTSFRTVPALVVAAMAGVLLLVLARRGRATWTMVLTLLLACGWAALATRMLVFAALLLAPALATELDALRRGARRAVPSRAERAAVIGLGVAVLVVMALVAPNTAATPRGVPDRFAGRLAALPPGSGVLVEDEIGGWIEYRFPELDPTMDGLLDAYPQPYLRRAIAAQQVKAGWASYVRDVHPTVAVLDGGSALTAAMEHRLHWREVARDGTWVYLVPPAGEQS